MKGGIGKRLFLGFFTLLILEAAIILFGIVHMVQLSKSGGRQVELMESMEVFYDLLIHTQQLVIPINSYLASGNAVEKEIFKIQLAEAKASLAAAKEATALNREPPPFLVVLEDCIPRLENIGQDIFQIERPQGNIEAAILVEDSRALVEKAIEALDQYHAGVIDAQLEKFREKNRGIIKKSFLAFLVFSLLGLVFSLILAYGLGRRIVRPINRLKKTCQAIAAGDLATRVEIFSEDEVGELAESFNRMIDHLNRYQTSLRQSEEKKRLIIETANDAFISIDEHGRITEWNRQAERIFGRNREEAIGRMLADTVIPPSMREAHRQGFRQYLATGEGPILYKRIEQTALHRAGHEFPIEITIWPLKFAESVSFNAFVQDITERKHLESIVLQSEKMAAVGQLAGGVAHEINNPLGIILGFSQNIARRIPPGDPLEMPVKSIEREAVRCKNLVQDLLIFSRIGKTEKEEVDLREAIEGTLSLILAQAKVKNVELVKEFSGAPKITANKNQIQQIIVNLSTNAVDAMPKGGRLVIRVQKAERDGRDGAEIQVQDTGHGIPPEILSKIFNPFFTTKEAGKGTGLGLSLVYEIVRKHNGWITVDSGVGKGTVFHVFLPR